MKAHSQKATLNKQRKLLSLKSLNSRLMSNTSFFTVINYFLLAIFSHCYLLQGDTTNSSVVFNLHNITAPKLKASVKATLK